MHGAKKQSPLGLQGVKQQSPLGAFFQRLKARLGAPKATTATAHKLATIIFSMIVAKSF